VSLPTHKPRPRSSASAAEWTDFGRDTFDEVMGVTVTRIEDGLVLGEIALEARHFGTSGFVHAAVIIGLADTLAAYGCAASLPTGARSYTTLELKTNFIAAAQGNRLRCRAVRLHAGRSTQIWDATVTDDADRTVAAYRCTEIILWPRESEKIA
jgi:1,4-dihydroxy-2-naphthoyl-CoA hydrolase